MSRLIVAAIVALAAAVPLHAEDRAAPTKEECGRQWDRAVAAGIFFGADMRGGSITVTVIVAEDSWKRATFAMKQNMVALLECTAFGQDGHFSSIDFRSQMTDRVLGEWRCGGFSRCELTVRP